MVKKIITSTVFLLMFPLFMSLPVRVEMRHPGPRVSSPVLEVAGGVAWAAQEKEQKSIEWFKQEMKISPKYLEKKEGVLGMSWGHFFTMLFLVFFASGALIVFLLRYKRTKDILKLIKEEADGSES
ncbi:MAG: hypothetical protein JRI80_04155 [Deltaproteobacteria bacterium]|nr:hypothetical protein [Deltaproteobacteria bacterium]